MKASTVNAEIGNRLVSLKGDTMLSKGAKTSTAANMLDTK